jgi:hypothetical protein
MTLWFLSGGGLGGAAAVHQGHVVLAVAAAGVPAMTNKGQAAAISGGSPIWNVARS